MDVVGIDLQQLAGDDIGLGRLAGGAPRRHRVLQRLVAQDAVGIPGDEHFHRGGAPGRVALAQRRLEGVVLGRVGEARAVLGDRVDGKPRQQQGQDEDKATDHVEGSSLHRNDPELP